MRRTRPHDIFTRRTVHLVIQLSTPVNRSGLFALQNFIEPFVRHRFGQQFRLIVVHYFLLRVHFRRVFAVSGFLNRRCLGLICYTRGGGFDRGRGSLGTDRHLCCGDVFPLWTHFHRFLRRTFRHFCSARGRSLFIDDQILTRRFLGIKRLPAWATL